MPNVMPTIRFHYYVYLHSPSKELMVVQRLPIKLHYNKDMELLCQFDSSLFTMRGSWKLSERPHLPKKLMRRLPDSAKLKILKCMI